MAEHELPGHESHETHESDPFGKRIAAMVAVMSLFLAIVTIASHRAHTGAVLLKTEANDKWSYYQAQRMKFHNLELGEDLLSSIPMATADVHRRLTRYEADKAKYEKRSHDAQEDARGTDERAAREEETALRFDFGEGLLEIGVVLTSLYFLSKNLVFPGVGVVAALCGIGLGVLGFLRR
jgi:hypothetical protein